MKHETMEIYKMSSDKEENNLKLTTSDILNALQHGATREDISEIRQEMSQQRSDFNSRIDKLDNKIDLIAKDLDSKIDLATKDLDNKIDTATKEFRSELKSTKKEMINTMKWGFGLAIVILGAIHFFH